MTLEEWLERYRRAWEEADVETPVSLFTEDAVYDSHPFRQPFVGRDAIRGHATRATSRVRLEPAEGRAPLSAPSDRTG